MASISHRDQTYAREYWFLWNSSQTVLVGLVRNSDYMSWSTGRAYLASMTNTLGLWSVCIPSPGIKITQVIHRFRRTGVALNYHYVDLSPGDAPTQALAATRHAQPVQPHAAPC